VTGFEFPPGCIDPVEEKRKADLEHATREWCRQMEMFTRPRVQADPKTKLGTESEARALFSDNGAYVSGILAGIVLGAAIIWLLL
jgi:hypothetical protein